MLILGGIKLKKIFTFFTLLFVFSILLSGCGSNEPAAGLPKDPSQMTNKQKQQYLEWEAKQAQQEWENSVSK